MILALKILHVLLCLFLIVVVLLQHGKGQDIGAAFGGSSQTVFGPSGGGSFFGKLTGIVAILFMLTSVGLGYFSTQHTVKTVVPETAPTPASPAVPGEGSGPAVPMEPPSLPSLPGEEGPPEATPETRPAPSGLDTGAPTPAVEAPAAPESPLASPAPSSPERTEGAAGTAEAPPGKSPTDVDSN